jgi:hypothetical protein
LRSGRLATNASGFAVRHAFPEASISAAAELAASLAGGIEPQHAALLLEVAACERLGEARLVEIELVTSGPDLAGGTRDTGVVLRQPFATAEKRALIVGFAVHQGREVFGVLGERMRVLPDLSVRICLDVRRNPRDTTRADALVRRFADRFLRHEWPGPREPEVFYDPRSLDDSEKLRASLHAKCVVVDGVRAYVGSANLTEAAQLRNIEIGIVVNAPRTARAIEEHFEALIHGCHLARLPLLVSSQ